MKKSTALIQLVIAAAAIIFSLASCTDTRKVKIYDGSCATVEINTDESPNYKYGDAVYIKANGNRYELTTNSDKDAQPANIADIW